MSERDRERDEAFIAGNDFVATEQLLFLMEAMQLENIEDHEQEPIDVEILGIGGQSDSVKYYDKNFKSIIPPGQALVRVSTLGRSLDGFWNTFHALCEYDKHQDPQV